MSGWANHIEPIKAIKGTRQRICRMWRHPCQSQAHWNAAILDCREYEAWREGAGQLTNHAVLARKSGTTVYRISDAMLEALRSVDSLTESRARCT